MHAKKRDQMEFSELFRLGLVVDVMNEREFLNCLFYVSGWYSLIFQSLVNRGGNFYGLWAFVIGSVFFVVGYIVCL